MKKTIIICLLCLFAAMQTYAQRINHRFDNVSMAEALRSLNKMQKDYTVNFIYDELEDFSVTTTVNAKNVPDAIRLLIGFYPIKLTQDGNQLFVECTHKTARRYIGKIISETAQPLEFANITLLSPRDSSYIGGGVSNSSGVFVIPSDVSKVLIRVSYVGFKTICFLANIGNVGTIRMTEETKKLKNVVIKAQNHKAIDYGVAYTPTPDDRRHSSNYLDLLNQMMVAGLHVDAFNNKVETAWGGGVHLFIDGQEATDWQLKSLRPKEVARVEYLMSPPEPQYKNYQAVVNFVLHNYSYGGYVYADGSQSFVNNTGDYNVAAKFKRGSLTLQSAAGVFYHNANDIETKETTTFIYDETKSITKDVIGEGQRKQKQYFSALSARYDSKNITISIDGGLRYTDLPVNRTSSVISFASANETTSSKSTTEVSSDEFVPYINAYFQLNGLDNRSILYGGASFSYNRNNSDSRYTLQSKDLTLLNKYNEHAYLPSAYVGLKFPLYKQNFLTLVANTQLEMYRTDYTGTTNTYQKLNNNYYQFSAQYSHRFSDAWSAKAALNLPIQSFNVNDSDWITRPYINGSFTLNGKAGTKHSFYAAFSLTQTAIEPSYYNTVYRRDTELEGSKGNADLKTMRRAAAWLSYTWMPSNTFSLNVAAQYDNITNDIVPWWHQIDGLMIREMVNSGDFNPIYLSLTPSLTLFEGKLRLQPRLTYIHEWHDGLYHVNSGYFGVFPNVTYRFDKHFLATLGYRMCTGKGYMRGTSTMGKSDYNKLDLQLQYTTGNFFLKLRANHLLAKGGWWKEWLDSNHIHQNSYQNAPWDGRYITISASYTFNFGKKATNQDNLQFKGTSKSSAL